MIVASLLAFVPVFTPPTDMASLIHYIVYLTIGGNAATFAGGIRFVYKKYSKFKTIVSKLIEEHDILWAVYEEDCRLGRRTTNSVTDNTSAEKLIFGSGAHQKRRKRNPNITSNDN